MKVIKEAQGAETGSHPVPNIRALNLIKGVRLGDRLASGSKERTNRTKRKQHYKSKLDGMDGDCRRERGA